MNITTQFDIKNLNVDLLFILIHAEQKKFVGSVALVDKMMDGAITRLFEDERCEGKEGEIALRYIGRDGLPKKIILLGVGKNPLRTANARKIAAVASQKAREQNAKFVAMLIPEITEGSLQVVGEALTEGVLLGDYHFLKYKDEDLKKRTEKSIDTFTFIVNEKKDCVAFEKGIAKGMLYARATIFARELVNEPSSEMTPTRLMESAKIIAEANPKRIALKVYDKDALTEMKAGGILAVAKGSDEPPYMVHLTYSPPKKAKKKIVLVGKGITFDSGGLSLKPSQAMEDMKIDMAGCAAMLGVFSAIVELAPNVEVHGISGICENMPSGKAVKPGDVVRTMQGKTIEILNTDAEGRVTLADTLHYGAQLKPDAMIDFATLTGACMVALGQEVAGMMTNTPKLGKKLLASAEDAGELLWELPLVNEYREAMKSKVADLKNISGGSYGGAITAGLFLEEFVGNVPWAHLDIAGPAWAEQDTVPHQPRGATGFGVRTVLNFLESL